MIDVMLLGKFHMGMFDNELIFEFFEGGMRRHVTVERNLARVHVEHGSCIKVVLHPRQMIPRLGIYGKPFVEFRVAGYSNTFYVDRDSVVPLEGSSLLENFDG